MIQHRPLVAMPAIDHRGIRSHFHFVPAGSGLGPASSLGPLIAWNDDEVAPVSGFPTHPHANVDIVTYVREGAIVHEDTLGNKGSAGPGEVQAMSAGEGIRHSERNDATVPVKLFQLWFTPRTPGGAPRWGMAKLPADVTGFVALASGVAGDTRAVPINTDARVLAARMGAGETLVHPLSATGKGYLVPTDAGVTVNGVAVAALDGCLIEGEHALTIKADAATEIVFVELAWPPLEGTAPMSDTTFKPVVFVKQDCPFCLKLRLFLLEAGLLDRVTLREFIPGTPEEAAIRAELDGKVEKITFPTAELASGEYLSDSDAIISRLAGAAGVDPATLPTYRAYLDGVFARMRELYVENMNLKKQLA